MGLVNSLSNLLSEEKKDNEVNMRSLWSQTGLKPVNPK